MKFASLVVLAVTPSMGNASPVAKVVQMLSDLQGKIIKEGETAQKSYEEFSEWCEDRSSALSNDITTGKSQVKLLEASISQETASSASLSMKVDDLASAISVDEADLKAATEIRTSEASAFAKTERDLTETVDMLRRASVIIEREMKGGASMLQLRNAGNLAQALTVLVQASAMNSADASKLTSLIQSSNDDEGGDVGAPAGEVYSSHSGDILETLSNLLDKAEQQLADLRNQETTDQHNFELLKQSLMDEIKFAKAEMSDCKKSISSSGQTKASAQGDLDVTSKTLAADIQAKADLHHECMTRAEDFEAETKSRGEELNALAQAKKVIKETTGGAEEISYSASFLQVVKSKLSSGSDLANFEAVRLVRDLARKHDSAELNHLAQKMVSAMQVSGGSSDVFAKIKGLIRDMVDKLESEAEADATEKAWCDRNLADTRQSKAEKTSEIGKLSSQIDAMSAKSAQLKEQVAALQASIAKLVKSQAEMDTMRSEEHEAFVSNKADMQQGLEGVKLALKVLTEYYSNSDKAHAVATGAGEGIIGLLEVVESDFSKGLAEINSSEEAAVAAYEQATKENEIERTTKEQDVKYKTKESTELDQSAAELASDRATVQTELDAVQEYLTKLEGRCVAKAETFAERKARFEAEIAGLKDALRTLQDETALVQRRSTRSHVFLGSKM